PFGTSLSPLDVWDVVAYVRTLHPSVTEALPTAARWTAHEVALPSGLARWFEAVDASGAPAGMIAFGADGRPGDVPPAALAAESAELARAADVLARAKASPAALGPGERIYLERCAACHGA